MGATLAWVGVSTEGACLDACDGDEGCFGISFYPDGEVTIHQHGPALCASQNGSPGLGLACSIGTVCTGSAG